MAGMRRGSRVGTVASRFGAANAGICTIAQPESPAAVAQLEAMASVEGIDALFLGPAGSSTGSSTGY